MFGLGIQELIVIVVVILLLIDHKRIPEFTRGVGKLYREFKRTQDSIKSELMKEEISSVTEDLPLVKEEDKEKEIKDEKSKNGESGRAG